jgi:hypothetical protein
MSIMNTTELSSVSLRKALKVKTRIEALQSKLDTILGAGSGVGDGVATAKRGRKRRMSAAGRARIAAAARKRWRKVKAAGRTRL